MNTPFPAMSLIVSCQASPDSALYGPDSMARMAREAASGGAAGIRANGPVDVAAIRAAVDLPIVGINKIGDPAGVFITPTVADAAGVIRAGAMVVAVDGTRRPRPDGSTFAGLVSAIHATFGVLVMADVDDYAAGVAARADGADLVATTLSGYTGDAVPDDPDIDLVARLASTLDCPVVAEGRYATPRHVRAAFDAGAYAVVVGTAITNPCAITRRFREVIT
jgi:N-acylglucosamine-6-phosphate 2-epimerase